MVATPGNSLNITAAGQVAFDGVATFTGSPLTQYNTLVGSTSNGITNIAPGTAGFVLTSQGATSNPVYAAPVFTQLPWTDEGISFAAAAGNGYFTTAAVTATLPASPSQGNTISFIADASTACTITANTGQIIRLGNVVSASAGTCASTKQGDSITLIYRASDTAWIASHSVGTWTVT